jgi:hypothetical protein
MDLLNIIKQHKKPIIIVSAIVVFIIVLIWIFTAFRHDIMNTGTLYLRTAPSGASVTIEGEAYANGEHVIKTGNYTVKVEKDDFEAQIVDFVIEVGKDTIVTIALKPIDESNTWYIDHPDDGAIYAQTIDQAAEIEQAQFLDQYPIMNYVPYTDTSDDKANSNRFKIDAVYDRESIKLLVTLNTCSDYSAEIYKQAALDWLGSKGIDLSPYVVEFTTICG